VGVLSPRQRWYLPQLKHCCSPSKHIAIEPVVLASEGGGTGHRLTGVIGLGHMIGTGWRCRPRWSTLCVIGRMWSDRRRFPHTTRSASGGRQCRRARRLAIA
jgi:hypothetical protein